MMLISDFVGTLATARKNFKDIQKIGKDAYGNKTLTAYTKLQHNKKGEIVKTGS
jgi:hypothetical protein